MIDITLPLDASTPIFPGDPALSIIAVETLDTAPYSLSRIEMGCHTGTHADAPGHFIKGGKRLIDIPIERYWGPAWVVELPEAEGIERAALEAVWPADVVIERLLLKTPNSARWGTPEAGKVYQALTLDAAKWLRTKGVRLVGIDSLSIEKDVDKTFPVHHELLGNDVLIVEGLNLTGVAPGPYELVCLPIKLDVPDGGPVRAALRPISK